MLIGQEGAGPRSVGTLIAVLADGDTAGSMSSGCVEAAIIAEAQDVLASGQARDIRFGSGSPYVDIRLPCGASMDVRFVPNPDPILIARTVERLERREAAELALAVGSDPFVARYDPPIRLVIAGHGPETLALLKLANAQGIETSLLTTDEYIAAAGTRLGVPTATLTSLSSVPGFSADARTAVVILFHDHDWEPVLLDAALASEAFWIGAMGSERTAATRGEMLSARGHTNDMVSRVHGPIGLIASARDPLTLALSTLADVVSSLPTSHE